MKYCLFTILQRIYVNIWLYVIFTTPLHAQQDAYELTLKAKTLIIEGYVDSAARNMGRAGGIYENYGIYDKAILSYVKGAKYSSYFSFGEEAEQMLENAYTILNKKEIQNPVALANVYHTHATKLYMGGWYDSARVELNRSFTPLRQDSIQNIENIAENYLLLGKLEFFQNGNYQKSIQLLRKALELLGEDKEKNPHLFWDIYKWLGVNYSSLRDFDQSISYLQASVNIIRSYYAPYHIYESNVLLSYGGTLSEMGNNAEALDKYKRIETILARSKIQDPRIRSFTYSNIAKAMDADSTLIDKSIAYTHKAEEIWLQEIDTQNVEVGTLYYNLGDSYSRRGNHQKSLNYFKKALTVEKYYLGMHNPEVAQDYRRIAWSYKNLGQLDSSLFYMQKSLQAIDPTFKSNEISKNPMTKEVLLYYELYLTLSDKADFLVDYFKITSQTTYLLHAIGTYRVLADLLDYINTRYDFDNSRLLLKKRAHNIYKKGIQAALLLGELTDQQKYYELAWIFAEKSKYSLLKEAFAAHQVSNFKNIPNELLETERNLKEEYTREEQKLWKLQHRERDSSQSPIELQNDVFELKQNYARFQEQIKTEYPDYFRLKYDISVITPTDLQEHLTPSTACLLYYVMDSSLVIFTVNQDTFSVGEYEYQWLLSDSLTIFIQAIRDNQSDLRSFYNFSYKLYQDLIKTPLSSTNGVDRIILIPDGKLGYLPFDVLLMSETNKKISYKDLPYAIQRYSLNYAYSATLWLNNVQENISVNTSYIGFAPDYDQVGQEEPGDKTNNSSVQSLPALEGIYQEVSFAGKLFSGKTYLRDQATEYRLKRIKKHPAILHLAAHTLIDDTNPLQSRFIFSRIDTTVKDDGDLKVYEIYNMRLNSKLAVLSACNTGIGKLYRGEGMMSLSRAFMYAGCPSILTSLWRAKDIPTRQIMQSFFKCIKQGKPKDVSLRDAKLAYLTHSDPLQAHPANWATWVIIGSPESISLGILSPFENTIVYLLGIIFLIIVLLSLRNKAKR